MAVHPSSSGGARPGDVPITAKRKSLWDSSTLIWAVPVIALAIALFFAIYGATRAAKGVIIALNVIKAARFDLTTSIKWVDRTSIGVTTVAPKVAASS